MRSHLVGVSAMALTLSILACNLQANPKALKPDLPGTVTAQALTLQAPVETPTPTSESDQPGVKASVTSDTNCRTGPGQSYDPVFVAQPEQSFSVVGRNTPSNYWIIQSPAGGTCWLWGQNAVVAGDARSLPELPAPAAAMTSATKTPKPTKVPKPTATPTDVWSAERLDPAYAPVASSSRQCEQFFKEIAPWWKETVTLGWQDRIDGESGYWVILNGNIAELPANSTSYSTTLTYTYFDGNPKQDEFVIAAFRGAGSNKEGSSAATLDIPRCP